MTTFRATVTIQIERPDHSRSVVTETVGYSAGDNPRFDASSSEEAISRATRAVQSRLRSEIEPTPPLFDRPGRADA